MREQLGLLAPVFAPMLNDRGLIQRKRETRAAFRDLFGSVPNGVLILQGDGQPGVINAPPAVLSGLTAGEETAGEIAAATRELFSSGAPR